MSEQQAGFPRDWLDNRASATATDLDLAVLLVNTIDLLEDPADRLHDLAWLSSAFGQVGHSDIARDLTAPDLPRLRELRTALRAAFEATDIHSVAAVLNPVLIKANAVVQLVADAAADDFPNKAQRARVEVGSGQRGVEALAARLPAAVAQQLADHGIGRLGVCHSDPCRCAFVDRTRAGTRRYCCSWCNDRSAARAYRARKRG